MSGERQAYMQAYIKSLLLSPPRSQLISPGVQLSVNAQESGTVLPQTDCKFLVCESPNIRSAYSLRFWPRLLFCRLAEPALAPRTSSSSSTTSRLPTSTSASGSVGSPAPTEAMASG